MELQGQSKGGKQGPLRKSGNVGRRNGDRRGRPQGMSLGKSSRLVLAALVFAVSTWWALTRFSRPDPFQSPAFLSWSWWNHPLEINAPARLPVVSGTLTSLAVPPDGEVAYLAGQQGLLLRYRASSQEWERLILPDSLGDLPAAQPVEAPPVPTMKY